MTDLPDRIRIPATRSRRGLASRDRLHENIDGRRLPGDEGPITDARIAAEMIALCEGGAWARAGNHSRPDAAPGLRGAADGLEAF